MLLLSLDTSSDFLSLALFKDKGLVADSTFFLPRDHVKYLLPLVEKELTRAGEKITALDAIVVGTGPGSFIGLRIGGATAQALAYGLGISAIGIPSLDAIALNLDQSEREFYVVVDAKKRRVYSACYRFKNNRLSRTTQFQAIRPKLFCDELNRGKKGKILLTGDAIRPYRQFFLERLGKKVMFAPTTLWIPRARNLAVIASRMPLPQAPSYFIQPVYLHSPVQTPLG